MAASRFTEGLWTGVSEAEAKKVWNGLEWPEKAIAYGTAYDHPTSSARTAGTSASTRSSMGVSSGAGVAGELVAGAAAAAAVHEDEHGEHGVEPVSEPTLSGVVELNGEAQRYFAAQAVSGSKGGDYLAGRLGSQVVAEGPFRVG